METKETKEGDKKENEGEKSSKVTLNVATLLADAKTLAGEDANLLAIIEGVKQSVATPSRGRTLGPGSASRKVWGESYIIDYVFYSVIPCFRQEIKGEKQTSHPIRPPVVDTIIFGYSNSEKGLSLAVFLYFFRRQKTRKNNTKKQ